MTEQEEAMNTKEEEYFNDFIEEITEILNSNIDQKTKVYGLPIKRINNIELSDVYLQVNEHTIYVSIGCLGMRDGAFTKHYKINDRITNEIMKQIVNDIKSLEWDNVNCSFNLGKVDEEHLTNMFNKVFKGCSNIETTIKECCVCYNNTRGETDCNHPVCLECVQKLIKEDEEEKEENLYTCPYCREECYKINRSG